jgi:hypothetical protein
MKIIPLFLSFYQLDNSSLVLRLSKKPKWPIPIIFAPLKINNLQTTENRKMARFMVFRQARYLLSRIKKADNLPGRTPKGILKKNNIKAEKCLIQVSNGIFSFLDPKKKSVIHCNQAELLSKEELRRRIDSQIPSRSMREIPSYLKKDVAIGIIQSALIPKSMENLIKAKK